MVEATLDETWTTFQFLERHRRDLVFKTSALCAQICEHPEAALPGYAACFDDLNVVSAADLAGERGPIPHYANGRAISGRAGLPPSHYQSDEVDYANGPLVHCANRRLGLPSWALPTTSRSVTSTFAPWPPTGAPPARTRGIRQRSDVVEKLLAFHSQRTG